MDRGACQLGWTKLLWAGVLLARSDIVSAERTLMRLWPWIALFLMGCGILIFYYFGQTLQIHCYRLTGKSVACSSQIYWFDLIPVTAPQVFGPVSSASSASDCSSRPSQADACSSVVILHNETSQYRLSERFFNPSSVNQTVDAINTFIAADTVFVDVYLSDKITLTLTSCLGLPFVLLGALILWAQFGGS